MANHGVWACYAHASAARLSRCSFSQVRSHAGTSRSIKLADRRCIPPFGEAPDAGLTSGSERGGSSGAMPALAITECENSRLPDDSFTLPAGPAIDCHHTVDVLTPLGQRPTPIVGGSVRRQFPHAAGTSALAQVRCPCKKHPATPIHSRWLATTAADSVNEVVL